MLGEAISMLVPQVVGFRLTGALPEGATATDLVLTVTQILRAGGVVGKFVEYFGHGLAALPLADRATIGNMSPEYGATCGFFPVDERTLDYLRLTGRRAERVRARRGLLQGELLWHDPRRRAGVLAGRRARPRRPSSRASPGRAARRTACRSRGRSRRLSRRCRRFGVDYGNAYDEASPTRFPASDPLRAGAGPRGTTSGLELPRADVRRSPSPNGAARRRGRARRRDVRARARLRRDRRDHELHEHLQPAA